MAKQQICGVTGCDKPYYTAGYCRPHYDRNLKYGNPTAGGLMNGEVVAWLRKQVTSCTDDCIPWPFPVVRKGYGIISYGGKQFPAHRLLTIWAHGDPPNQKLHAAHSCNNSLCVNPKHLRWATAYENHQDKIANGTTSRGEKNWTTKLTEAQARTIKYVRTEGASALSREYGVDKSTVLDIRKGRSWAWL